MSECASSLRTTEIPWNRVLKIGSVITVTLKPLLQAYCSHRVKKLRSRGSYEKGQELYDTNERRALHLSASLGNANPRREVLCPKLIFESLS